MHYRRLVIYYMTGTGNALAAARWFADEARSRGITVELVNTDRFSRPIEAPAGDDAITGFLYPTHGFNLAWHIRRQQARLHPGPLGPGLDPPSPDPSLQGMPPARAHVVQLALKLDIAPPGLPAPGRRLPGRFQSTPRCARRGGAIRRAYGLEQLIFTPPKKKTMSDRGGSA